MFSINAIEGQSLTVVAEYKDSANLPVDITTWTIRARVGNIRTRDIITADCVITNGPLGIFQIAFTDIEISLLDKGKYIIEIARVVSGSLSTIALGELLVSYSLFIEV